MSRIIGSCVICEYNRSWIHIMFSRQNSAQTEFFHLVIFQSQLEINLEDVKAKSSGLEVVY